MPMRQLIQNVAFFTSGGRPKQPFLIFFLPDIQFFAKKGLPPADEKKK